MSREIHVFADWEVFDSPMLIGLLRADVIKGKVNLLSSIFLNVIRSSKVQVMRSGTQVSPGIDAPLEVEILREELVEGIQEYLSAASPEASLRNRRRYGCWEIQI